MPCVYDQSPPPSPGGDTKKNCCVFFSLCSRSGMMLLSIVRQRESLACLGSCCTSSNHSQLYRSVQKKNCNRTTAPSAPAPAPAPANRGHSKRQRETEWVTSRQQHRKSRKLSLNRNLLLLVRSAEYLHPPSPCIYSITTIGRLFSKQWHHQQYRGSSTTSTCGSHRISRGHLIPIARGYAVVLRSAGAAPGLLPGSSTGGSSCSANKEAAAATADQQRKEELLCDGVSHLRCLCWTLKSPFNSKPGFREVVVIDEEKSPDNGMHSVDCR